MIVEKYIMFHTLDDVNKFMNKTQGVDSDLILSSGRHQIDGQSVISVMTLGFNKPIKATYAESDYMNQVISEFATGEKAAL